MTRMGEGRVRWLLIMVLRVAGGVPLLAFLAVLLPVDWMAATHSTLGLGPFPRSPLTDYLTRSVAALYGFHGVLVLLVSTDLDRYRPVVYFVAWMQIGFGFIILGIDLQAPMPWWWTLMEGPSLILLGCLILWLLGRVADPREIIRHEP